MRRCPAADSRGMVAIEFVLLFPMLLMVFCFILQTYQLWMARQVVSYAAYAAARSALVHHPSDCPADGQGRITSGPVYESAVDVLSWLEAPNASMTTSWTPNAQTLTRQLVWLTRTEVDGQYVDVTVHYLCPLLLPLPLSDSAAMKLPFPQKYLGKAPGALNIKNVLRISVNCLMPKPYATDSFARIP